MKIEPGEMLLHYRLVEKIGEGGMGVVWKALDTTLDRTVAIKILPEVFSADTERLLRFEREAKTLAALNNPRIASLYGLHESEGVRFLSMEYVEGEDLGVRIARGRLRLDEALAIAGGITEALSAAHKQGIIHRDLKPANVMLTEDGTPKVLDFGLAKAIAPEPLSSSPGDVSASPTVTSLGSVAGVILGTASYMSPEQARAKPVDRRSDLWAFGCILYEMLTGRRLFEGETISDVLAEVLKTEPDFERLPGETPTSIRRLLRRCLSRSPHNRLHDAGDARIEIDEAFNEPGSIAAKPRRYPVVLIPILLLAGIAAGFALRALTGGSSTVPTTAPQVTSELTAPGGVRFNIYDVSLALSPDGSRLVFAGIDKDGDSQLYLRSLASGETVALAGTDGARAPFWSPDGSQIGFHASNQLQVIDADGGQPRTVADSVGTDGTWSAEGTILIGGLEKLVRVDIATGETLPLAWTFHDDGSAEYPRFLPDGRHFVYEVDALKGDNYGIWLGSLDTETVRKLLTVRSNVDVSSGHLVYREGTRVLAHAFNEQTLELVGEAYTIGDPVLDQAYPFHGFYTVAANVPRLVYLQGVGQGIETEMVWYDRQGAEIERTGIGGDLYNHELSPNGRRVALDRSTLETHGDIWIHDLARGSSRRLTSDPLDESRPIWSPDGRTLYFYREPDIYRIAVEGAAEPEALLINDELKIPHAVSPDGRYLLYTENRDGLDNIGMLDLGEGTTSWWLESSHDDGDPAFSPDGKWVAYTSTEAGRQEIYIDRFPDRVERFQVSGAGGSNPAWRADGRELFFVSAANELMVVPIDLDSETQPIGTPQTMFRTTFRRDNFDASADGRRFLVNKRLDPEISQAVLVQAWNRGDRLPE